MTNETMGSRNVQRSKDAFVEAKKVIPGGVNSPVRAFRAVDGDPLFIERGVGAYLYDIDGNRYIDYMLSWGPLIAGHAHPDVVQAVTSQALYGTSFGAPTEIETKLANEVIKAFPSMDLVRMVNSGTEATMSAIRLARAFTKRQRIVKFAGCYHGHSDGLLIRAGSGVATFGLPDSPGVLPGVAQYTLLVPYNDIHAVKRIFEQFGDEIAAVIVEPVAGNMGMVLPQPDFLPFLRTITKEYGALLIFDEVMTGFRIAYGGAQEAYGIRPDLTTLGKVIGGGLPVGAYGGREEIISMVAPLGSVYQAGTLSGNPLAMAAGLATLTLLQQPGVYDRLSSIATRLAEGFALAAKKYGLDANVVAKGAMFGTFFAKDPIIDYTSAQTADTALYARYFHAMLERGVYLAPSQLEAGFVSLAHTDEDVDRTVEAMVEAMEVASQNR